MRLYDIQKTTLVFRVYAWVHFIKHIGTNYKPTTSLFKSIGSQECVCVCAHGAESSLGLMRARKVLYH